MRVERIPWSLRSRDGDQVNRAARFRRARRKERNMITPFFVRGVIVPLRAQVSREESGAAMR
jgi:hypothetical protein